MKIRRYFPHERLPPLFETIEKRPVTPVGFVERPGRHSNAMCQREIDQSQTDLRLGAELDLFGDVVLLSTLGIVSPLVGQIEFAIQQALKAGSDVTEMHADDAVVHLAKTAKPLPAGPGGVSAALGRAGFVETPDSLGVRVFAGDDPLAFVAHSGLLPLD